MKEKGKKVPTSVDEIILNFPKNFSAYESFVYLRRLNFAYRVVKDVMGLTVLGVTRKGGTKNTVTARRFICRMMTQNHPNAGIQLLGSSVYRDHSTIVHYRKYDRGHAYNHYYSKKLPALEKRFQEIMSAEDFDYFDDGRLYTFEDFQRMAAKFFGAHLVVRKGRKARRRSPLKKNHSFAPNPKPQKAKGKKALVKRPH
jgi:hypothetical protein